MIDIAKTRRRTVSSRVECNVKIAFRYEKAGTYVVHKFDECHTHAIAPEMYKHFMKSGRKLNDGHTNFIAKCARVNIGTTQAYNLYKELVGGFANVGASNMDFMNGNRDLRAFVQGRDTQMVINNFLEKQKLCPSLYLAYEADGEDNLERMFWADHISRRNYTAFGDVVSFDATYGTNRYNMVFAPFTGVDNHKKCVTLAAGLLVKEDKESYIWLFIQFKQAMGIEPVYFFTDQDPGMNAAFDEVFTTSKHRFCMWHITSKLGEKAGTELVRNPKFMKRFNAAVWSESIEPLEFEE